MPAALESRLTTRILIVVGVLGLVFAARLDRAVQTAYDSDWVALGRDLRLPTAAWIWFHVVVGVAAIVFLLSATLLWRRRETDELFGGDLGPTSGVISLLALLFAGGAAIARGAAGYGAGEGALALAAGLNVFALLGVLVLALANGNLFSTAAGSGLARLFGQILARQRMNLAVGAALALALMFLSDTSGQAVDSMRSWTPLVFGADGVETSGVGAARLTLGVAAALLLALVVYESGVRLTDTEPALVETNLRRFIALGAAITILGGVAWTLLPFGPGIFLLGLGLLGIALLDLPKNLTGPDVEVEELTEAERNAPEWLAITPLLALAATSVTATVEAGLSGGVVANTVVTAVPALVLGALAVLLTRRVPTREMDEVPRWPRLGVVVGIVALSLVLLLIGRTWLAAAWGLLWIALLGAYGLWLFHRPPSTPGASWLRLTVPVAVGGGIAVALGIHADPLRTGRLLGVFTLALVALALAVVLLHLAVHTTLRRRPPNLLWWFGLKQLPVLTLLLLWWIAVGVAQVSVGPRSLHDARLIDRVRVAATPAGEATPLERAFTHWIGAQEDLRRPAGEGPVPLVLVAAHGGGIRAAYWTVAALDCIVGVSAEGVDPASLETSSEDVRSASCSSRRRTPEEQRAAARRIFMASGVSGGAVGLYVYARQLLHTGRLGGRRWIDLRLGDDFASPAVGWGLFHDLPNRLFGLHPAVGAPCGWEWLAACVRQNRAAVLEQTFDDEWGGIPSTVASLRSSYDRRFARSRRARENAGLVPLLAMNATLTGGEARAVVSAANLGSWPLADADDPESGNDRLPLAGTAEVRDALCETRDLRLSTAALLAARFPYVTPSGRVPGRCGYTGELRPEDEGSPCAASAKRCEGRYVDGGYADNSGLFTLVAVWPSLRSLIVDYNLRARAADRREIAPMIVEIDNHYQASLQKAVPSGGTAAETTVPLETAFGSRRSIETFARASAFRILPTSCTVTLSPSLHPGLIAPLGWELSEAARADLRAGLTRAHPSDKSGMVLARRLRQIQARIAGSTERKVVIGHDLAICLPRLPTVGEER
jgi:hypothetical protein